MYSSPPNCASAAASFLGIHACGDVFGSLLLNVEAKLRIKPVFEFRFAEKAAKPFHV
jgi:hypothetical protein